MDELFNLFNKDPKKISKKIADEIIDNPPHIGNYRNYLDRIEGDDIARIITERPMLISWFENFLKKLSQEAINFVLNRRPDLSIDFSRAGILP
jgi:hypothetical protein